MEENRLKKVIVFIPAFNEEMTIADAIDKTREIYPVAETQSKGYFIDLLVVNDGSTDQTEEIAEKKGVNVVSHTKNLGLGAATRKAMMYAYEHDADVAVKLDADMQHDPSDIEAVILPILENKADICWGSRFIGNINYKMPFVRLAGNNFFTWLMKKLTDYEISDAQTGMMAYGKKYLEVFELFGNYNPPQQLLIDASCKHMRYAEVAVVFNERTQGTSFVSLKYPFKVIANIVRVLIYANPIRIYGNIGLFVIVLSVIIAILWLIGFISIFPDTTVTILFVSGVQIILFGILADILIKKRK